MMPRRVALAIVMGIMSVPIVWRNAPLQAAATPRTLIQNIRAVDQHLDRALRLLNAAEEFANTKQMSQDQAINQAIRLVGEAERKADKALNIVRQVEAAKLTKGQVEQVERFAAEARFQVREAEAVIDRIAKKNTNHKTLRGLLIGADRRIDQAAKLLHKIVSGL
jgi:hypothetical protein